MDKIVGLNYPDANSYVNIKDITENFHSIAERVSVIPFETTVSLKDKWTPDTYNLDNGSHMNSSYKVAGYHLAKIKLPDNQGVTYSYVLASPFVEDTAENMEMLHQMGYCGVELVAHTPNIPDRMHQGKPIYLLFRARNSIPTVEMKFTIVFI